MEPVEQSVRRMTPVTALPKERPSVDALRALLEAAARTPAVEARCELRGPDGESIELPESIFYLLKEVVDVMARGDAITVVPIGRELTTQQAADLLNISRQYLVRLLEGGELVFRKVGTHRRLRIEDVLAYKARRDREREDALDALTALSEEIGYPELTDREG
ncbi:MAG TPA: helix-turn-helix domain-containing protein [Kofleriaceae bacterium]|jgi:excisionase family DNA binding protein